MRSVGAARRGFLCKNMETLRPFQKLFIREALKPGIDTAVLSIPRGNGKSFLAGKLLTRFLTPGDPIHVPGKEAVLLSGSIEQARIVFKYCRTALEPTGEYRFIDSATRVGITHKATGTRLRVHGSNSKTAFGLVNTPFAVWDEPGSGAAIASQELWAAVSTSQGKPGSPLTAILIGTIAPSTSGWWADLIAEGSNGSTFVMALQGDIKKWDQWPEIRRCNPLTAISPEFRAKLIAERDKGRKDSRLKARFLSYRLNVPTADASTMLLTTEDFETMCRRPVPPRVGRPIVGLDLGAGRAWSGSVAIFKNGRIEARALCPGIPSLADQERRDLVETGTYQALADQGVLMMADGVRVPPAGLLVAAILAAWGKPASIIADRFRLPDLQDAAPGCRILPRMTRWSESSADIRALRSGALDGPFSIAEDSRALIAASLAVSMVLNDDSGSVRLVKRGTNNTARDDISAALILASGLFNRTATVRVQGRPLSSVV